jgi:PAS domain-containing protein
MKSENILRKYEWVLNGDSSNNYFILLGTYNHRIKSEGKVPDDLDCLIGLENASNVEKYRRSRGKQTLVPARFDGFLKIQEIRAKQRMKLDGEEALEHLDLFPELLEDSNSKFISLREVAACAESLLGIGYDSVYCILDENGVMQYVNAEFCEVFNLPGTSIGMLLESFSYASLVRTMNDCSLDNNAVPVACV